ncbi:MAG TPA: hypothetical protein VEK73_15040, partial [Xanthobacteraceae bacterium]|nr:hypothetical protein [Xanthobacteraceae bacterium]
MSRKSILAIAAVAAIGLSSLAATDASARFGGGFGGGHFGGHFGNARVGRVGVTHTAFRPARLTTNRNVRTFRPTRVTNFARVTPPVVPRPPVFFRHPHGHHWWWTWCRFHHHYNCGGYDVGPDYVDAAPEPVIAQPISTVCNNDCDYFLN